MKYIQIKTEQGYELIPAEKYTSPVSKSAYVIPDIQPYIPMGGPEAQKFIDRSNEARYISSRSRHREFLKRNNFVEVGDDSTYRPDNVASRHGKTQENFERFNKRKYRGYDVTKMAKSTPVQWSTPDIARLKK